MADPIDKRALRRRATSLVPDGQSGSAAQLKLAALPELARAETVALFAPQDAEPPLGEVSAALARRDAAVVYPRVAGEGLAFHRAGASDLRPGYGGIAEPAPSLPVVAIDAIDLFVVPGLLFDRDGYRLGRGHGHYDRALGQARDDALRVGYCTSAQLVVELPRDSWDVPMDVVVTDREVLRPRGSA